MRPGVHSDIDVHRRMLQPFAGTRIAAGALAACLAASFGASAVEARQTLSAKEQQIVASVDANGPQALALLQQVVDINSGTLNAAGVRRVGDVFRKELDALGFTTTWVDGTPFGRAGHLVARRTGSGPRLLLIGHLDTVFEPDSPFQKFERVGDHEARGPGIIDMKGGDVIIVFALKALAAAGLLEGRDVTVVMTGDEEDVGEPKALARAALVEAATRTDVALGFEDGPGDPRMAVVARRGFTGWLLKVHAKPAHSSQVFSEDVGSGAIYEIARVLSGFHAKLSAEPMLSLNPGAILGGTTVDFDDAQARGTAFGKTNVVAEHAVASGDLRVLSREQLERAEAIMREVVKSSLPHATAEITFDDSYPPMAPTDGNRRLLAMYDQASRDVGAGPVTAVDPRMAGAADVSFVAAYVPTALDGIGLMGRSDHTANETADLRTLSSQTKRAALLVARLFAGQK